MTSTSWVKKERTEHWDEFYLTSEQSEVESERFKDPEDATKILIVVDMLLVGYDVPIVQAMYLDKGLEGTYIAPGYCKSK